MSTAILEAPEIAAAGKTRMRLCARKDLVANSGAVAWHDGHQIALFLLSSPPAHAGKPSDNSPEIADTSGRTDAHWELYGLDNRDPFSGANVIGRGIVGDLDGALVIASPIYKQHFRLEDGICVEDPSQRLRTWTVKLDGDDVVLIADAR